MNVSRKLAFLLRHSQDPLYISLDGGWAKVSEITKALSISRAQLDEIVATDESSLSGVTVIPDTSSVLAVLVATHVKF